MSVAQLNGARKLVEADPSQYSVLLRSVLPVCDHPDKELRLWCAGFIADYFCTPLVDDNQKTAACADVYPVLKGWIDDTEPSVVKLAICILAETYPRTYSLVFAQGFSYKQQFDESRLLNASALRKWTNDQELGIKVACIKLAQVIVLTHQQTVPHHPVLDNVQLAAEGSTLLDTLLLIFYNNSPLEFPVLSATVNVCVALAVSQPHLAGKIVNRILGFDLSKLPITGSSIQQPLVLRWISKIFKLALHPLAKMYPQIPKYLAGLNAYCTNQSLKRRAEFESSSKRPKISTELLPVGPQPYKSLYNLCDNMLATFYARDLQFELAVTLAVSGLEKIGFDDLNERLDAVEKRILQKEKENANIQKKPTSKDISREPEDLAKDASTNEIPESKPENSSSKPELSNSNQQPTAAAEGFEEDEPAESQVEKGPSRAALEVVVPEELEQYDLVFNRLLGRAPVRLVSRLVARGLGDGSLAKQVSHKKLYAQLVPDFRSQFDAIILWLSEVYYALEDRAMYFELVSQVVDDILPKLEVDDSRIFIRLLSELPEINREIVYKLKSICLDPERAVIGSRAIKFLIMFKPPCRKDCLDLAKELVDAGVTSLQSVVDKYK